MDSEDSEYESENESTNESEYETESELYAETMREIAVLDALAVNKPTLCIQSDQQQECDNDDNSFRPGKDHPFFATPAFLETPFVRLVLDANNTLSDIQSTFPTPLASDRTIVGEFTTKQKLKGFVSQTGTLGDKSTVYSIKRQAQSVNLLLKAYEYDGDRESGSSDFSTEIGMSYVRKNQDWKTSTWWECNEWSTEPMLYDYARHMKLTQDSTGLITTTTVDTDERVSWTSRKYTEERNGVATIINVDLELENYNRIRQVNVKRDDTGAVICVSKTVKDRNNDWAEKHAQSFQSEITKVRDFTGTMTTWIRREEQDDGAVVESIQREETTPNGVVAKVIEEKRDCYGGVVIIENLEREIVQESKKRRCSEL